MFSRTQRIIGSEKTELLKSKSVILFGVGGVGSYTAEALARAGIGRITVIDSDIVAESNINRQLIALHSTLGQDKVEVIRKRILDINPECRVTAIKKFATAENIDGFFDGNADYVIDAIDNVTAKIALICKARELDIPVISVMGTGNKTDATKFVVTDIYKTSVCPLCRVMRYELRRRNIEKLKVVYSTAPVIRAEDSTGALPGSMPYVPGVAGLIAAGEVICDLLEL